MKKFPKIVILHASADNFSEDNHQKGWVSSLQHFLLIILGQMTNDPVEVVLKNEHDDHSRETYTDRSIMLPVFSKAFLERETLLSGLKSYLATRRTDGGLLEGDRALIFKLYRYPVEIREWLPEIKNFPDYNFYQTDIRSKEILQYDRFFDNDLERNFWMKMVDLAYDIYQLLQEMSQNAKQQLDLKGLGRAVYLAETGEDLIHQRDMIKRELIRHGYKVFPEHALPLELNQLKDVIYRDLAFCEFVIHMIGDDYGKLLENEARSVVDIQNVVVTEYTREKEKAGRLHKLIWLKPEQDHLTERQKVFIENLRSDAESLENAEVVQISIQELKNLIRYELSEAFQQSGHSHSFGDDSNSGADSIYLIYDQADASKCRELAETVKSMGMNVIFSDFEGDIIALRNIHQEKLVECDASIIYMGESKGEWMQTKLLDILKSPGFGRTKPMKATAVVVNEEEEVTTNLLATSRALLLRKNGAGYPELLEPFLTKLKG